MKKRNFVVHTEAKQNIDTHAMSEPETVLFRHLFLSRHYFLHQYIATGTIWYVWYSNSLAYFQQFVMFEILFVNTYL